MRYTFIAFLFLINTALHAHAQIVSVRRGSFVCGYADNDFDKNLCKQLGQNLFMNNTDAKNAVEKILNPLGLNSSRFHLNPCPGIDNAVAVTYNGIMYIFYDNNFMKRINQRSTDWSEISILAHEIGHHLHGHTLSETTDLAEKRRQELEADEFSGFILHKLDASLKEAQAAIATTAEEKDDTNDDHPRRSVRLNAIMAGYQKAENQQSVALRIDSRQTPEQFVNEGTDHYKNKDYTNAIRSFDKAIQMKPNYGEAYIYRGYIKNVIGKYEDALNDFNNAVNLNIRSASVYTNRGNSKHGLGDYRGALSDFNISISIDNKHGGSYICRGLARSALKDYNGAINDFNQAMILGSDQIAVAYNGRGSAKTNQGNFEEAIKDYNTSISLDNSYASAYTNRGVAKHNIVGPKIPRIIFNSTQTSACEDYKKACDLGDNNGCTFYNSYCK